MTYSLDFRKKVIAIKQKEQLSMIATAKRFGIGIASVMRWTKKIEPQPIRERPSIKIDMKALKNDVERYPDAYLKERAERFKVAHNSIWLALKRLNVSYKKNSKSSQGGSRKAIYVLPRHR